MVSGLGFRASGLVWFRILGFRVWGLKAFLALDFMVSGIVHIFILE